VLVTFGNLVGIALAGLVVALVAAIVIGLGYFLAMRRGTTLRAAFSNRWVLTMALAIGLAFILIRWLQGAFSGL
jgi:hypothetical protein